MNDHEYILQLINNTIDNFKKKKNVENISQLMKFLKITSDSEISSQKICLRPIKNQGAWKCRDCQKNKESFYCNECWGKVKDKHISKNHNYEYYLDLFCATCDCGNPNAIDEEFTCSKHKKTSFGFNMNITSNFQKEEFKSIHRELFKELSIYIIKSQKNKQTNDKLFKDNIASFVKYISELCFNSKIVLNWIADLLLDNYPTYCDHKCIDISKIIEEHNNISILSKNKIDDNHDKVLIGVTKDKKCCCPFIRLLMSVWNNKNHNLLLCFSQNYKLKKSIGVIYLLLYNELLIKGIFDFSDLNKEFLFIDIRKIIKHSTSLLNELLQSPKIIIENYIKPLFDTKNKMVDSDSDIQDKGPFKSLKRVINYFKFDILSILSEDTKECFTSDDCQFYLDLIEVLANFQNINSIKPELDHPEKGNQDAFNGVLLQTELSLLDIFTIITTILDFENDKVISKIFAYFNKKIFKKEYKNLEEDEYSYHISLFRGFSIFLNRYCFFYAEKNNDNVTKGLELVSKKMPNYKECTKILISELFKLFGFISACAENLLIYYGEDMNHYEKTYYYTYKFVYRDFCLMKYLLPQSDIENSFKNIFMNCDIKNSYSIIEDLNLFSNGSEIPIISKWLNEGDNRKYMKFTGKILSIILNIIRNNGSLIWNLGSSYKALKSCQIKDDLLIKVVNNDSKSMKELAKELIINKAITKENSVSFRDLFDGIFYPLREIIGEESVEEIIKNMFNHTVTTDQKMNFSIKDDYLNNIDTNYILSPVSKANAEKYLYNFKKNNISIFNKYFFKVNKYEDKLSESIYQKIFFTEENMNFIFDIIIKLIKNDEFSELQPYFLNVLLNYFDVFLEVNYESIKKMRDKQKEKIDELIDKISDNNLKDEFYKSYCDLIIQKVNQNKAEEEKNDPKEIDNKKRVMMIKKKLVSQLLKSDNQLFSMNKKDKKDEEKKEEDTNEVIGTFQEQCIFCRNNIDASDIKRPYGKIGYFLYDNFIYNSFFQVIKKEFDKYIEKNRTILTFKNLYDQPKERKSLRIISCGHYIHFSCFFQKYMNSNIKLAINNLICPFCKKYGNTYFPEINHLLEFNKDKIINYLYSPFDCNYVLNYGTKYEKIFETFVIEDNNINSNFNLLTEDFYKKANSKVIHNEINTNHKTEEEYKKYIMEKYPDLFNSCKHLIEGFFGIKSNMYSNFDLESEGFNKVQNDSLLYCFLQYRDFMDYIENSTKKKEQIYIWKNIILSFRMLLKLNIIRDNFFVNFNLLLYQVYNLELNKGKMRMINNDHFRVLLSGILFLACVFFDYEDIEGYEKYILLLFLPVLNFGYFLRKLYLDNSFSFNKSNNFNGKSFIDNMNKQRFYLYLSTEEDIKNVIIFLAKKLVITNLILKNDDKIKDVSFELNDMLDNLNLSNLKNKKMINILDELSNMIKIGDNKDKLMDIDDNYNNNIIKPQKECPYFVHFSKYNYEKVFDLLIKEQQTKIKNEECERMLNPCLFSSCLNMKHSFIPLPKLAVDFLHEKYNFPCQICKSKGKFGLICLDCGKKVNCQKELISRKKTNDNNSNKDGMLLCKHVLECGGGSGAFLFMKDLYVIFVQQEHFSRERIPLYLDKFGEPISGMIINNKFKLNEKQLEKALQKYFENDLVFPESKKIKGL